MPTHDVIGNKKAAKSREFAAFYFYLAENEGL
jgi:hypothetical protein